MGLSVVYVHMVDDPVYDYVDPDGRAPLHHGLELCSAPGPRLTDNEYNRLIKSVSVRSF